MNKTKAKLKKKSDPVKGINHNMDNLQANVHKHKEAEDQFHEKKQEAKKHGMWCNVFECGFSEDLKNSINNFVNLANNSISGAMHANNDCTKQTQNMLGKISAGISNAIEKNIELSGDFLKCQTAVDMIELQQKFFEMNFSNMRNLYSDIGHCCQSMATGCYENASDCAEKSAKCFVH
jgi:SMC interacting uncharacterized protein involved in chromosome segregation